MALEVQVSKPDLAALLREQLVRRDWSQARLRRELLARGMEITDQGISAWMQGGATPSINRLPLLAEVLDLTVSELVESIAASKAA